MMETIVMACDCSARRISGRGSCRDRYWWSSDISEVRKESNTARRKYTRARRQGNQSITEIRYEEYRRARRNLRLMIKRAKINAWNELISSIDEDPWGLPYRIVMGKLRRSNPVLTETLDPVELGKVLDSLFPTGERHESAGERIEEPAAMDFFPNVTSQEVALAMKRGVGLLARTGLH